MQTLKEIGNNYAKKGQDMADTLTEEAPILAKLKFIPSSHNFWNVGEKTTEIKGAGVTEFNAPLPSMSITSGLEHVSLFNLGGVLEVPQDKANAMGGANNYFAKREPIFLKETGMNTEGFLYKDYFLKASVKGKTFINAGGSKNSSGNTGLSSLTVMRLDQEVNTGLFDPTQFKAGTLLNVMPINGGNLYFLRDLAKVLGFGVEYLGRFGWQLLDPKRTVCSVVNTSSSKPVTMTMLNDAIANVRGNAQNTLIMSDPYTLNALFPSTKLETLQTANGDKTINTLVTHYNGIPIVPSYNLNHGNQEAVA